MHMRCAESSPRQTTQNSKVPRGGKEQETMQIRNIAARAALILGIAAVSLAADTKVTVDAAALLGAVGCGWAAG